MDIKKHIPHGRENAVNLGTLCDRLGVGQTAIKRAIREERKKGTPILSGREGYWLSTDRDEIEHFNNLLRGQALARSMPFSHASLTVISLTAIPFPLFFKVLALCAHHLRLALLL